MNRILKRIADSSELNELIDKYSKSKVDRTILNYIKKETYATSYLEANFPFEVDEYEHNGSVYKSLQDKSAQDMLNDNIDFKSLAEYILNRFKTESADISKLSEELNNYINNELFSKYEEAFNKSIEQYIKDNIYCGGVNEYGDAYNNENGTLSGKEVPEEFDNNNIYIDNISLLDDSVGDSSKITDIIDINNRDYAFVYVDGEILKGTNGETHSQILNEFCEEKDITAPNNGYANTGIRPIVEEIEQKLDTSKIAFGHFIDNMAFIEVCEGCSETDVVIALKKEYKPDKIYFYDREEDYITRLAKRL